MSLINEALKKAQRQRANDDSNPAPVESPAVKPASSASPASLRHDALPRRRKPAQAQNTVLITIGCVLLLLCGGLLTYIFIGSSTREADQIAVYQKVPATATDTPPAPVVQSGPAEIVTFELPAAIIPPSGPSSSTDHVSTTETLAISPSRATSPQPDPQPDPQSVAASVPPPVPATTAAPVAVDTSPEPVVLPAPTTPGQTTREIYLFLEKIRVAGIKASPTDPRVLMNDRMYRLNDIVDARLQLRLTGINNRALTFTDANDVVYTHKF